MPAQDRFNCIGSLFSVCFQGNKGGVSIRFDIGGVNLIIVNCHLAAHMEQMAERIEVCIIVADPSSTSLSSIFD